MFFQTFKAETMAYLVVVCHEFAGGEFPAAIIFLQSIADTADCYKFPMDLFGNSGS